MIRLFVNHMEAYLQFASKIFVVATASYQFENHKFYDGTYLLLFNSMSYILYLCIKKTVCYYILAVLSASIVGETMINTLYSLTLLQNELIQPILSSLMSIVQSLHTFNQKMCSNSKNVSVYV